MEESLALSLYFNEVKTEVIHVGILVVLEKLFELGTGRILMKEDVVKRLNNAFVVVSEPVGVGVCCRYCR